MRNGNKEPVSLLRLRLLFFLALGALAVTILAAGRPAAAEQQSFDEYAVKAAFLYNFAKFTEWPSDAFRDDDARLMVCIAGRDPFGEKIGVLENRLAAGRRLQVKRTALHDEKEKCHIIYYGGHEAEQLHAIRRSAMRRHILVISEAAESCSPAGMINFFVEDRRVRFEIHPSYAEQAGLKISSHLLKLARVCREDR